MRLFEMVTFKLYNTSARIAIEANMITSVHEEGSKCTIKYGEDSATVSDTFDEIIKRVNDEVE